MTTIVVRWYSSPVRWWGLPTTTALFLGLFGCDRPVESAVLDRELAEARDADRAMRARYGDGDESATWTVTITGRVPATVVVPFREVERLATTEYQAKPAVERADPPPATFRGARLSDLLARANASQDLSEVTIVANDGFRATFEASDVLAFPVMLSVLWDGARIPRSRGGPLYTTLPNLTDPRVAERYTYSWWVFYVTHLVADTAPLAITVSGRTFGSSDLAALPQTTIEVRHGFRVGWPSGVVRIAGVRVRDLLASTGTLLATGDRVRVRVMAPVPDADEHAVLLESADVASEDLLLGLRFGPDDQPIPARLGGPVVLAFPPGADPPSSESEWPTFVRALEIERGAAR